MGKTRRHKKYTHVASEGAGDEVVPSTFVMERGKVGKTLNQLVLDLRRVMEPHTASKLKVRQRNVLKDFVQVAGPLGVTHFIILSRTDQYVNLRLCRLPRGPTITFHVNSFCLAREVVSSLRKPATSLSQFLCSPLLVLNNFAAGDKPSKLMATMLQNMFPSINIQTVKLANIQRCVLFNCSPEDRTVEFRHYNIRAVARGVSRGVKRLAKPTIPDLSKYKDISDYMLGGYVSESEGEEMVAQEVTLPQDMPGRGNLRLGQSVVRLTELGPRMTLRLVKIESGLCDGEVLHHEFIHKSKQEAREVRERVRERRRVREERRRQQEANVSRKKREKEIHKQKCLEGQMSKEEAEEAGEQGSSSDSEDDTKWYRQEVGEEPDPDTFIPGSSQSRKRRRGPGGFPRGKRWKQGASGGGGRAGEGKGGGQGGQGARESGRRGKGGRGRGGRLRQPLVKFSKKSGFDRRGTGPARKTPAGKAFRKKART